MKQAVLCGTAAACICFGLVAPTLAAGPVQTGAAPPPPPEKVASAMKPAEQCLTDLHAFDDTMQNDGYWLSGYGYPMMGGFGYEGYGPSYVPRQGVGPAGSAAGYQNTRPGYDVRTLIAAANILARDGKQQACENVLGATRDAYKIYVSDMHDRNAPMANMPGWQKRQIAAAKSVVGTDTSFRSDQLIGTEVRNPQNEELGSVDDIVMSPQTDKIAYLIVARGGIFGFDEKYVAVPWPSFKVTPSASLLVLDTTKAIMKAGPLVSHDFFAAPGQFDQESQKVDAYWKAH